MISDVNSIVSLIEDRLYVMNCFSLAAVFVLGLQHFMMMFLGVDLFRLILLCICSASCMCRWVFSSNAEIFSHYSSRYCLFLSLSYTIPILCMLVLLMVFHRSLRLYLCFFFSFSLCPWLLETVTQITFTCLAVSHLIHSQLDIQGKDVRRPLCQLLEISFCITVSFTFFFTFFGGRVHLQHVEVPRPMFKPTP